MTTSAKPSLNDAEEDRKRAYEEYLDFVQNEWRHDKRKKQQTTHVQSDDPTKSEEALSDARRKKRWQEFDPEGREAGSGEEEVETSDADCYKQYEDELCNAWRMKK